MRDFDTLLSNIGEFGPYQKRLLVLMSIVSGILGPFYQYSIVFLMQTPEIICKDGIKNKSDDECFFNASECYFSREYFDETIVSKWGLVCDSAWKVTLIYTACLAGSLIGYLCLAPIQDWLGRKPAFFILITTYSLFGLAGIMSNLHSITAFTVLYALKFMFCSGSFNLPYVFVVESVGPNFRAKVNNAICLGYAFGAILMGLIAWASRTWIQLGIASNLPILFFWVYFFFLDESPRWALAKGKLEIYRKIVRKIVVANNCKLDPELEAEIIPDDFETVKDLEIAEFRDCKGSKTSSEGEKMNFLNGKLNFLDEKMNSKGEKTNFNGEKQNSMDEKMNFNGEKQNFLDEKTNSKGEKMNFLDEKMNSICSLKFETKNKIRRVGVWNLFTTPNLRLKTIVILYLFAVNNVVYYGMSYNIDNLKGNPILIFISFNAVEIPAVAFCVLISDRIGRVLPCSGIMIVGGISSISTAFIPSDYEFLIIGFAVLSKFSISASYILLYQIAGEIFPTEIRATGVGFSSLVGVGATVGMPSIIYSARAMLMLPMIIFGIMSFIGGAVCLFLPETLEQPLPETIEDARDRLVAGHKQILYNLRVKTPKNSNPLPKNSNPFLKNSNPLPKNSTNGYHKP